MGWKAKAEAQRGLVEAERNWDNGRSRSSYLMMLGTMSVGGVATANSCLGVMCLILRFQGFKVLLN
jgi:hypothetical protein